MLENYKHNDIILIEGILHKINIILKYNPYLKGKSKVAYVIKLKENERRKIGFVENIQEVKKDE